MKPQTKSKNLIRFLVSILIVAAVLAGGIYFLLNQQQTQKTSLIVDFADDLEFTFDLSTADFTQEGLVIENYDPDFDVTLYSPIRIPEDSKVTGFTANELVEGDNLISYQISYDSKYWYYFNGEEWSIASGCDTCINQANEINENIDLIPEGTSELNIRVLFSENTPLNTPLIDTIEIEIETEIRSENIIVGFDSCGIISCVSAQSENVTLQKKDNDDKKEDKDKDEDEEKDKDEDKDEEEDDDDKGGPSVPTPAKEKKISPVLECVDDNGDGTYTAYFGYLNRNDYTVTIQIGGQNRLIGSVISGIQPTDFISGRQYKDFSIVWGGGNLVWKLKNKTATASPNSKKCNYPPIVNDDNIETNQNQAVTINVTNNDNDPDGSLNLASLQITVNPSNGTTTVNNSTGEVTYTPNSGYSGIETFTYQICDDYGDCGTAIVTVNVKTIALAPVRPVLECVLNNGDGTYSAYFGYKNDNTFDVEIPHGGDNKLIGNVISGSTPTTFLPGRQYKDFFIVWSGSGNLVWKLKNRTSTASVNSPSCNQNPEAEDDIATTQQDTTVDIAILSNDTDSDGTLDPNSVTINSQPSNGSISYDATSQLATYTPNAGYFGTDQFTYEVCDNNLGCDTATVTITITQFIPENEPPITIDDEGNSDYQTSITINVIDNDSDSDGTLNINSLTITVPPSNGTVVNNFDGTITYSPNSEFTGSDSFSYQICDNDGACSNATVTVNVAPPPLIVEETIIEEPVITLADTADVIPDPEINFNPNVCGVTYEQNQITFTGLINHQGQEIGDTIYQIGENWVTIPNLNTTNGQTQFSIPVNFENSGSKNITVRTTTTNGENTISQDCSFEVALPLTLGANQINTEEQPAPKSDSGLIYIAPNKDNEIYLEAVGATKAEIQIESSEEKVDLEYVEELKLWKGKLNLQGSGILGLTAVIYNQNDSYSRQINKLYLETGALITDAETKNAVENAEITIYKQNNQTGEFVKCNCSTYGQPNPVISPDGQYSLVLPSGTFYFEITKEGYQTSQSRIFTLNNESIVDTDIELTPKGAPFFSDLIHLLSFNESTNFEVKIAQVSSETEEIIGENLGEIALINETEDTKIEDISSKKKIIITTATWNTFAQQQLNIIEEISEKYQDEIDFVLVSTIEPLNLQKAYINRGEYNIQIYKSNYEFYDYVKLSSLNYFLFLNNENEVVDIHVGKLNFSELEEHILESLEVEE